jgi:hypothetical protein
VLALECTGYDHGEIGKMLGIAKGTVDKEASTAHKNVVPPKYVATRDQATAWGWLYNTCCLASAWLAAGLPLMQAVLHVEEKSSTKYRERVTRTRAGRR